MANAPLSQTLSTAGVTSWGEGPGLPQRAGYRSLFTRVLIE